MATSVKTPASCTSPVPIGRPWDRRARPAGVPFDNVDPESTSKPIHWNLHVIQRFMLQHSLRPAALILIFHAPEAAFRTGWFIESLVTQVLMILPCGRTAICSEARRILWWLHWRPAFRCLQFLCGSSDGLVVQFCFAASLLFPISDDRSNWESISKLLSGLDPL